MWNLLHPCLASIWTLTFKRDPYQPTHWPRYGPECKECELCGGGASGGLWAESRWWCCWWWCHWLHVGVCSWGGGGGRAVTLNHSKYITEVEPLFGSWEERETERQRERERESQHKQSLDTIFKLHWLASFHCFWSPRTVGWKNKLHTADMYYCIYTRLQAVHDNADTVVYDNAQWCITRMNLCM